MTWRLISYPAKCKIRCRTKLSSQCSTSGSNCINCLTESPVWFPCGVKGSAVFDQHSADQVWISPLSIDYPFDWAHELHSAKHQTSEQVSFFRLLVWGFKTLSAKRVVPDRRSALSLSVCVMPETIIATPGQQQTSKTRGQWLRWNHCFPKTIRGLGDHRLHSAELVQSSGCCKDHTLPEWQLLSLWLAKELCWKICPSRVSSLQPESQAMRRTSCYHISMQVF